MNGYLGVASLVAVTLACSVDRPGHSSDAGGARAAGGSIGSGGLSSGGRTSLEGGTSAALLGGAGAAMAGQVNSGAGGAATANGGMLNAAGGTEVTTGGAFTGNVSSSGAGAGGAMSSGGAAAAAGGGAMAGGTAGSSTTGGASANCATYSGSVAKESAIFKDGFGTSRGSSPWSGYAFTYSYGTGATISPPPKEGCFKGAQLCVNGSLTASDSTGAGIGWNIAQSPGSTTAGSLALTGAVKITFAGVKAGTRVSLGPTSGDDFCYSLTAAEISAGAATIPVASFKQSCWDVENAVPYAGAPVKSILLVVPGSATSGAAKFDYCVVDVEPD